LEIRTHLPGVLLNIWVITVEDELSGIHYVEDQSVNNMLGGFSEWQSKGYPVEY
jgi:rhodanese-related sulfurtransferase